MVKKKTETEKLPPTATPETTQAAEKKSSKAKAPALAEPSADEIASMASLAHHRGEDQRKHIGTAKNEEGVKCDAFFVVAQDGSTSTVLEPIAE